MNDNIKNQADKIWNSSTVSSLVSPVSWENDVTPLNAANLNRMSSSISTLQDGSGNNFLLVKEILKAMLNKMDNYVESADMGGEGDVLVINCGTSTELV